MAGGGCETSAVGDTPETDGFRLRHAKVAQVEQHQQRVCGASVIRAVFKRHNKGVLESFSCVCVCVCVCMKSLF